MHELGKEL